MENDAINVLFVEDDTDEVMLLQAAIRDLGASDIKLISAERLSVALDVLGRRTFDAVLFDLSLPDSSGVAGVEALLAPAGEAPIIVCTGLDDEAIAQEAIRTGAQDYLVKNPKLYGAVPRILRYAVERSRLVHATNRRVEQARRYAEILLTKVIAVADGGLAITNAAGKFLVANPALAELCGRDRSDLTGRDWTDILPEEFRRSLLEDYRQSIETEGEFERERLTIRHKDGGDIEISMRSVFLKLGEGSSGRVLSFGSVASSKEPCVCDDQSGQFLEKLRHYIGDTPTLLAAGRIQTVGLQKVRSALGDNWQDIAERVYMIAEKTIAERLSSEDSFTRNKGGDFIIVFARLSEEEAQQTAQAIGQSIRLKILGSAAEEGLSDSELSPATRSEIADVSSDSQSIELTPEELRDSAETAGIVTDKIKTSLERVRATTRAMLSDLGSSCRSRLREVQMRDRKTATLMIHDLDPETRALCKRIISTAGDSPSVTAEIDFIVLGCAAQKIYELGVKKLPLVAVDVHYSTLNDNTLCNKYLSICQSLDEMATSSLVFNLLRVPPNTHTTRIAWFSSALKPYSRLRMMRIRRPSLGSLVLSDADIAMIMLDYNDVMSVFYRDLDQAKEFVGQVRDFGARVLVDRVGTANARHLFRDLDVDFISYELEPAQVA